MKLKNAKMKPLNPKLDPILSSEKKSTGNISERNKGEFYYIKIENLLPYKKQGRTLFDEQKIKELASTIEVHGIRQPLTVISSSKDSSKYEIISGERRYRAAVLLGLDRVPCIILVDSSRAEEVAIIENIQREDLHPIELGAAYDKLAKHKKISLNKLSEILGVSPPSLKECVQYTVIEEDVKNLVIESGIKERRILRKIKSLKSHDERKALVENEILKRNSNLGKKYNPRKVKLFSGEFFKGKLHFELKNLKKLDDSQRQQVKDFAKNIIKSIED